MSVILPALFIAFAAFCVWLGVRIFNRKERWAKRTALGLVISLPILYVVNFGPACWISSHLNAGTRAVTVAYRPITWCFSHN